MELDFQNVTKYYGKTCALNGFSGTFGPGIYGIIGRNGAGKSTLMQLIADTIRRGEGSILYDGVDILKRGTSFRKILGYMPQHMGGYDEMTAAEFLYYVAGLKGISGRKARQQIFDLLADVHLTEVKDRKTGTFSGGMKQRVMFASALLGNPDVLLLDEPSAGLDPGERIRMRHYIQDLGRNKIVFLATHIVSDIESIATEILLMDKGKILVRDTPDNLIAAVGGSGLEDVYLAYIGGSRSE